MVVYCLLKNKDQVAKALASPDAFSNAFSEIGRWGTASKMGFARYARAIWRSWASRCAKGQMVLMMPHLKDHDPAYFDHPEVFDVGGNSTPTCCSATARVTASARPWPSASSTSPFPSCSSVFRSPGTGGRAEAGRQRPQRGGVQATGTENELRISWAKALSKRGVSPLDLAAENAPARAAISCQ